ncbi:N-(5'-phosphoribosyl)anthranilate isomerase [Roseicyclus persicicus]|uniref:N-(5'-phosphoribosyl)anthranilate isomerase n=1 Tax=Roseicyclus persicicus TaxID=2650661 RepID=A0A7X6H3K5_9RHOB|nr:N-(5'-phosphoribosyl)anthranilate isomerase [Roseibacterium persicicum]NKX46147.1 N-(5'-phosphoribosyl)anthranilate isomerase [Roseibacterium persicicum]
MSRPPALLGQDWLDQVFHAKAAQTGGVVRRKIVDVEREIGRDALELAVRRRGFHLIECDRDFVIICSGAPLRVIC